MNSPYIRLIKLNVHIFSENDSTGDIVLVLITWLASWSGARTKVDHSLKNTLAVVGMGMGTILLEINGFEAVLLDISVGFFISGIILFVLTALLLGIHGLDHSGDHSVDGHDMDGHDISHEVSHDVGDHSIDGHDIGDHDISHGVGHEDVHSETGGDSAPLMLLVSTFMLSFGAMGISLFQIQMDSFMRAMIIFLTPIVITVVVARIWRKLAKSELGAHVHPKDLIGSRGTIVHQTTYRGGSVRVPIEGPMGSILLPAKSYEPGEEFYKGDVVEIVDAEGTTCLIKRIQKEDEL
jgi:membrane protein implicated in regulation of membrane protease activity